MGEELMMEMDNVQELQQNILDNYIDRMNIQRGDFNVSKIFNLQIKNSDSEKNGFSSSLNHLFQTIQQKFSNLTPEAGDQNKSKKISKIKRDQAIDDINIENPEQLLQQVYKMQDFCRKSIMKDTSLGSSPSSEDIKLRSSYTIQQSNNKPNLRPSNNKTLAISSINPSYNTSMNSNRINEPNNELQIEKQKISKNIQAQITQGSMINQHTKPIQPQSQLLDEETKKNLNNQTYSNHYKSHISPDRRQISLTPQQKIIITQIDTNQSRSMTPNQQGSSRDDDQYFQANTYRSPENKQFRNTIFNSQINSSNYRNTNNDPINFTRDFDQSNNTLNSSRSPDKSDLINNNSSHNSSNFYKKSISTPKNQSQNGVRNIKTKQFRPSRVNGMQAQLNISPYYQNLKDICNQIQKMVVMDVVQMISCELDDMGLNILVQAIHNYPNQISSLKLVRNQITDEGVKNLLKILSSNIQIQSINLTNNNCTDLTLEYIWDYLQENKVLEVIHLGQNHINPKKSKDLITQIESLGITLIL